MKLWQRKFQSLLSSDPEYKSLRAEFFYGVPEWESCTNINKARIIAISTTRLGFIDKWKPDPRVIEDEQWFSDSTIAVIYLFTLNKGELNNFVEENEDTSHELLDVFNVSKNFWKLEEWECAFYPQEISSHGIYKFIEHRYVRLFDIKNHKSEEKANEELEILHMTGEEHLKENQLFLTFTDKKIEFLEENSIPEGKFYLLIDPSNVCDRNELGSHNPTFSCKAKVKKDIHPYLQLITTNGNLLLYMKKDPVIYSPIKEGDEIEVAITKTELLNEIGEPVKHKFVAVDV